jgi:hypothetical protein
MPFLHGVRDTVVRVKARKILQEEPLRMHVQEEMSGETGRHRLNKEPRLMTGAVSGKQDNTWQDLQEDHGAGGCEANSWDFHYSAENE